LLSQAIADEAKADLDEAMPALNAAIDSLKALNKNDIVEIKSFPKPPPLVQMTMEAVCILKQEKPDWDTVSKHSSSRACGVACNSSWYIVLYNDMLYRVLNVQYIWNYVSWFSTGGAVCARLLTKCVFYPWQAKRVLGDTNFMHSLEEFDKDNIPESVIKKLKRYIDDPQYQPETVAKQSKAAMSLCMWSRAMDVYNR
jgi:dynein heavy chain